MEMICVEEYRGEDSAILLEHKDQPIYQEKLHPDADLDGTTLRFALIHWASSHADRFDKFLLRFFDECLKVCAIDHLKEKMFLTGTHKRKLKLWQFMLTLPELLIKAHNDCEGIVETCIMIMGQNNILEVRYYAEIFLMKMLNLGS